MKKNAGTVSYTTREIKRMASRSDWDRAAAMTPPEIAASIARDPDEAGMIVDWDGARIDLPEPKAVLHMRVDSDVLEFFRRSGRGYQTRINAILRSYMKSQRPK